MTRPPPTSTLFPYTTLFRSIVFNCQLARAIGRVWPANHILVRLAFQYAVNRCRRCKDEALDSGLDAVVQQLKRHIQDRKSTRLNSSHRTISYAVFCLKKKKK